MPVFGPHYKKGEIPMKTKDYLTPWHVVQVIAALPASRQRSFYFFTLTNRLKTSYRIKKNYEPEKGRSTIIFPGTVNVFTSNLLFEF